MENSHCGKKRGALITLAGIVALLLCPLLILSSCAPQVSDVKVQGSVTAQPTIPQPSPTAAASKPVAIREIHMLDAMQGWAMTNDNQVLHTTTGGGQWQIVTPNTGWQEFSLGVSDVLDAHSAWVTVQSTNKYSVYYTHDDGRTWLGTPVLASGTGITQITFVDAQHGWLLFNKGETAANEEIAIFRTTDGGATWLNIANADQQTATSEKSIPMSGKKTGISFINTTQGWITGTTATDNLAWLYTTGDGGVSWQTQSLSLPSGTQRATTLPPTFFDTKNAVLPVKIATSGSGGVNVYVTHDSGTTWNSTNSVQGVAETLTFTDIQHGWLASSNTTTIETTADGGQHWNRLAGTFPAGIRTINTLNFVSTTTGWAIGSSTASTTALFQTHDGGKTWTQVNTTAV